MTNEGHFEGTEPIREAVEADLDVEALEAVINRLEVQLGRLIYDRDSLGDEGKLASLNEEITTLELNIGANRLQLQRLMSKADSEQS